MNTPNTTSTAPVAKTGILGNLLRHFYRSSLSRFYNYHEYSLKKFVQTLADSVRPDEVLLDVGAGDCQYKPRFVGRCKYISQDIGGKDGCFTYDQIDIRSEIYEIPLADASVDFILCTQVLEHLKYPVKALHEMHRLLKPGGRLCLTVPFCAEEHMIPHDFFRYTKFGLDCLLREQGFEPVSIVPEGGRFITFGRILKDIFPLLTTRSRLQKTLYILQAPIIVPVLFALYFLDRIDKNKFLTHNYDVIAKKL